MWSGALLVHGYLGVPESICAVGSMVKWSQSICSWTVRLCTSEIILFNKQITSVKRQGKNLHVSHLYSRHKWKCGYMGWLPVNNAQWALLECGFSIVWDQLAMISKLVVSFQQWGTLRTSALLHNMAKNQKYKWEKLGGSNKRQRQRSIYSLFIFTLQKWQFGCFFLDCHNISLEMYKGHIDSVCVHENRGFHNRMYYWKMFSQWRPNVLWMYAGIWYTRRAYFLEQETYDSVSFWNEKVPMNKENDTEDRKCITFSPKWPFLRCALCSGDSAIKHEAFRVWREDRVLGGLAIFPQMNQADFIWMLFSNDTSFWISWKMPMFRPLLWV